MVTDISIKSDSVPELTSVSQRKCLYDFKIGFFIMVMDDGNLLAS